MPETREVTFTNAEGEDFHIRVTSSPKDLHGFLFCVHGAGLSGDCFSRLTDFLQSGSAGVSALPESLAAMVGSPAPGAGASGAAAETVTVVTYDLRCHGQSTSAGGEESLTLERLVADFRAVLAYVQAEVLPGRPAYVLGHSLGGSIVAHGLSGSDGAALLAGVRGLVLVEVVEGTAKMSLAYMDEFLRKRPADFASVKDAETWFLQHGGMHSPEGAAVSVPPLLRQRESDGRWVWRTDLHGMRGVWSKWFDGVDAAFVESSLPKMLCVANAERLDTALTIAQMQGKFQYEIIGNGCGHYVMDDATGVFGTKLRSFIHRIEYLSSILSGKNASANLPKQFNNATIPPNRM